MNDIESLRPGFDRIQRRAFIIGLLGWAALAVGAILSTTQFYQAYLYGYILWFGLTIGCLGVLLLHHLVSGHWGHVIQRFLEAGALTMILMAVLFVPIIIGLHDLYPWTDHTIVEKSHVLEHKTGYLNIPFFLARTAGYFLFWILITLWLTKWSRRQDETADASITPKIKMFTGPSTVLFVLTLSLASVDWFMSLEPEWYSTLYGMLVIVSSVLTTLAFCILMISRLADRQPFSEVLTTRHYHHLGNLLMAFTILWAYMAFSQFLIIWSGNLPEDNFWYLHRLGHGWNIIAGILVVGHFFLPLFLLLSRKTKRAIRSLSRIAVWILIMRFVDLFWMIVPSYGNDGVPLNVLYLVAPVAIGGIWIAAFLSQLKKQPILPLHDPRFEAGAGH